MNAQNRVAATNAAIIALAKACAEQGIKHGVQVNRVSPGAVMTGRRKHFLKSGRQPTTSPSKKQLKSIGNNPAFLVLASRKRLRIFLFTYYRPRRSG
jgi:NAD(P)-dependent dehydrogenase (short-subunit alcohol dehydrogenase family)